MHNFYIKKEPGKKSYVYVFSLFIPGGGSGQGNSTVKL